MSYKPDPAEVCTLEEAIKIAEGVQSTMTPSYVRSAVMLSNFILFHSGKLHAAFRPHGAENADIDDGA